MPAAPPSNRPATATTHGERMTDHLPPLLSLDEQVLLRAWIRGVPLAALDIPAEQKPFSLLAELRLRLFLKATRLQQPQADRWLKRQHLESWEQTALHSLTVLLQQADIEPTLQQPLSFWMAPDLADCLGTAQLRSIEAFIGHYQSQGKAWWQAIPRLGRMRAQKVEVRITALFPGVLLKKTAPVRLVYETAIVPLARFLVPEALDGTRGSNRASTEPFIPMPNDHAAIHAWLALRDSDSHTYRAYQRETERLFLWAIMAKHKALSSLDAVDMADFRTFLKNPQPAETWIGVPHAKAHPGWKPFTGALSLRSIQYAETILDGLFNFLVQQRYLQHNPLSALPSLNGHAGRPALDVNRAFSPQQWQWITAVAQQCIVNSHGQARRKGLRTWFILHLAYRTGLRLHELAQATVADIYTLTRQSQTQHWLNVLGKGQKRRQVPLPPATVDLLCETYQDLTSCSLTRQPPSYPLIPDLHNPGKAVTPLAIHKVIKAFFTLVAQHIAAENPEASVHLAKASTHWLRHTHGSVAVEHAIPLTMIRDNLGHASIATTSLYLHTDADARYDAFKQLAEPSPSIPLSTVP